jgi:hypothetical protein
VSKLSHQIPKLSEFSIPVFKHGAVGSDSACRLVTWDENATLRHLFAIGFGAYDGALNLKDVGAPVVTITSGATAIRLSASARTRSPSMIAQRYSIWTVRPSIQPSSASPC